VPFYVAVPSPSIDWYSEDLADTPIEERAGAEVLTVRGIDADGDLRDVRVTGSSTAVANPGFDVTPARLVTGIITERGIATPSALAALFPAEAHAP
jgi:methylthioribose-1-phosphate isomerase